MKTFLCTCVCALLFLISSCVVSEDPIIPTPEPEPTSLGVGKIFHANFAGNADDISVNGLVGTVTGATLTTDRHGNPNEAYRFDGIDDVINYGPAADFGFGGADTYTMTAWVKLEDRGDDTRQIIISKFNGGVAAGWYLSINGDEKVQAYRNVTPWSVSGASTISYDEYVHVAASFDGSNFSVWLNGELDGTSVFRTHPNDRSTDMVIGGIFSRNELNPVLKGTVDDVRIYNRVLTAEERNWLANN